LDNDELIKQCQNLALVTQLWTNPYVTKSKKHKRHTSDQSKMLCERGTMT